MNKEAERIENDRYWIKPRDLPPEKLVAIIANTLREGPYQKIVAAQGFNELGRSKDVSETLETAIADLQDLIQLLNRPNFLDTPIQIWEVDLSNPTAPYGDQRIILRQEQDQSFNT